MIVKAIVPSTMPIIIIVFQRIFVNPLAGHHWYHCWALKFQFSGIMFIKYQVVHFFHVGFELV